MRAMCHHPFVVYQLKWEENNLVEEDRKRKDKERKEEKIWEEEPVPVHLWFPNGKTSRGRGSLLLWLLFI